MITDKRPERRTIVTNEPAPQTLPELLAHNIATEMLKEDDLLNSSTAQAIYNAAREHMLSIVRETGAATISHAAWIAYDEEQAAYWELIRTAACEEEAPLWAVAAAGDVADRHRRYAEERRYRVEREKREASR